MDTFRNDIDAIRRDNTSGSTAILQKTLQALLDLYDRTGVEAVQKKIIIHELNKLFFGQPGFAVLFHFINGLFLELERGEDPSEWRSYIEKYKKHWSNSGQFAVKKFLDEVRPDRKCILLHSNSSSIHKLLSEIRHRGFSVKIIQTLSGPGNEGKLQAVAARKKGFEVTLIHESAVGKFIPEIDLAVFGADVITKDRFINKTGTFSIATLFGFQQKPVYVISDSRKIIDPALLPDSVMRHLLNETPRPPEELWPDPPQDIGIVNYWFEATPLKLVSGLATESEWIRPFEKIKKHGPSKVSGLFNTN